jgi:hypothetical protein
VSVRLLADANFNARMVDGLRRRIPAIDFAVAHGIIPLGLPDPEVLVCAANLGRVLVSHDLRTMPGHFYRFLTNRESPGLILIPATYPIGPSLNDFELMLVCSTPDELRNRITWLPFS